MIKPPGAACVDVKHSTLACALDRDYRAPSVYASADTCVYVRFRGHAQNRSPPVQDVGCMGLMLVYLDVVASVKPAGAVRADPHVFFEAGHVAASRAALARTLFFL
jgi:hypothetical protein